MEVRSPPNKYLVHSCHTNNPYLLPTIKFLHVVFPHQYQPSFDLSKMLIAWYFVLIK